MKSRDRHLLLTAAAVVALLLVLFALGRQDLVSYGAGRLSLAATGDSGYPVVPFTEFRENSPDYQFINPLLFIETDQRFFPEFDSYDAKVASLVSFDIASHRADSVSVYVRDLDSGHWSGTNLDEPYEPSSMLKVVALIAVLRNATTIASESSTTVDDVLSQPTYYPGQDQDGQFYTTTDIHDAGMYPTSQLIDMMIKDSDNQALAALLADKSADFTRVFQNFRLPVPTDNGVSDFMSVRKFSVVFRALFNATYLSPKRSESVLRLLSETKFNDGLVAGVPRGIVISHKFGEHTNLDQSGAVINKELHDCGIVYYPGKPYLVCIMTKGHDFPTLAGVISSISKLTYDFMANYKR